MTDYPFRRQADQPALTRIPRTFYDDHVNRELPAPPVVRKTKTHYWIDADHEHAEELADDAEVQIDIAEGPEYLGLRSSARATLRALCNAWGVIFNE